MNRRQFALVLAAANASAYSRRADKQIWAKSRRSDVPLFRFGLTDRGSAGYVGRDGTVIIPPVWSNDGNWGDDDFFDGLARVRKDRETCFIEANGEVRFRCERDAQTGPFSEGLAPYRLGRSSGYVDRSGKIAIALEFEATSPFQEGRAMVTQEGRIGYLRKDGTHAVRPKFILAYDFSEGVAWVCERKASGLYPYFINTEGNVLFDRRVGDVRRFSEGLAPVLLDRKWGFLDKQGNLVIDFVYDAATPFAEGLACVRLQGKWGYIDRKGALVIPASYDYADAFSEGLAVVGDSHQRWYINRLGIQAFPGKFRAATGFVNGRAHVRIERQRDISMWAYIDTLGVPVFSYEQHSESMFL